MEDSIRLSLQEVATLVEDQIRKEAAQRQAAIEAALLAQKEAAQKEAAAKAQLQKEQQAEIQAQQEREQALLRAQQLRLEEVERSARIQMQAHLEEVRLQAEAQALAEKPIPWRWVALLCLGLGSLSGSGIALQLHTQNPASLTLQSSLEHRLTQVKTAAAQDLDQKEAALGADRAQYALLVKITQEKKDAEQKRRLDEAARQEEARRSAQKLAELKLAKQRDAAAAAAALAKCLKDTNDPLCGLKTK